MRQSRPRSLFWPGSVAALVLLALAGLALGSASLPVSDVLAALISRGDASTIAIVQSLRLPRVVLAALVGAGLGMAGAALQGSLRNGLAEPYLLGVSGGAAVGAVLAVALGLTHPAALPLAAFAGAMAAVIVTLGVARAAGGDWGIGRGRKSGGAIAWRADPRVLLMAGVIVGAFANAAIMVVLAGAAPDSVRGALWWMMGSLAGANWNAVQWLVAYTAAGGIALLSLARDIDVLTLGEEPAAALGLDVERAAGRVFVVSSLIAAATVAAAGLIGFVGLVVPHMARSAGVQSHRLLIAGSAVAGAALVVAADLAARTLRSPAELPLGAVTALVGVPFFLFQLRRLT
ncbi:MAG: FecCD family ABC transporter permease [Gemmatimonadaceae bacterium]